MKPAGAGRDGTGRDVDEMFQHTLLRWEAKYGRCLRRPSLATSLEVMSEHGSCCCWSLKGNPRNFGTLDPAARPL